MLLLDAMFKGAAGDPGDRLVNASSMGNFQNVREILEAHPDKVNNKSCAIKFCTAGFHSFTESNFGDKTI